MGCENAVFASSVNGLIVGLLVGLTLGFVKAIERGEKSLGEWLKELIPQAALVGLVIGFSHSLLANCTGILQGYGSGD